MVDIDSLLTKASEKGVSDVHLAEGFPPLLRISGRLQEWGERLTREDMSDILTHLLPPESIEKFREKKEWDFAYAVPGVSRFRGNIMLQRGSLSIVLRIIPKDIPSIEELKLPSMLKDLCYLNRGLVLVTGPTGSGKSTTLAAMLDLINQERDLNIITVEDPIEYLHKYKKSIIKQREVGEDTNSFADALRHVLRHDPDIILVGEMRDLESIQIALTAAETGHLVFSTLHTQTAPLTINRVVDVFSEDARSQVRQQLAGSLRAIVSQQLCPEKNGGGRVVATEVMLDSPAVKNVIRENKEYQMYSIIQTGSNMHTMDQSLMDLYRQDMISLKTLQERAVDVAEVEATLGLSK